MEGKAKNLRDFVGSLATLKEKPDGYTSSDYNVTVGRKYRVHDVYGSCLVVSTNVKGQRAFISAQRFGL